MRRSLICGALVTLVLSASFPAGALAHPSSGIVVDRKGQVFFTDNGSQEALWKIDAAGKLTRFRQGGWHWLALDERGSYSAEVLKKWFEERITMNFGRVPLPDSKEALLQADGAPVVIDRDGKLYWARANHEIARLSLDGKVTLLAPSLKATADKLGGIKGLASGLDGYLYVSCPSAILKIQSDGKVTPVVHPVVVKGCDVDFPDNNPNNSTPALRGLAVDSRGIVYAAATGCHCVVKITPGGHIETVLKAERPWSPTGVAVFGNEIYVLEYTNANVGRNSDWLPRVRKIARDGKVTALATVKRDR